MKTPEWLPLWMDEDEWHDLQAKGWTLEMLEDLKRKPEHEAVDQQFLQNAKRALAEVGYGALEFIAANPGLSTVDLAKSLNRGANARGLVMAVYEEAIRCGVLRETAKDLFVRTIDAKFPEGWFYDEKISAHVKIGGWNHSLYDFVNDERVAKAAKKIMRHLAMDHPPPEGWKPEPQNDPLIDELFDRYWPSEEKGAT